MNPILTSQENQDTLESPARRRLLRLAGVTVLAPGLLAACRFEGDAPLSANPGGYTTPLVHGRAVAVATAYPNTISVCRSAILEALKAMPVSSLSVALADGEDVVWSETFGYTDKAQKIPPGPNTMYGIGSVSKVFSAVATMILVDRGLVDLDVPLVNYVPSFSMQSPEYRLITPRMLLNHSSGLPGTHGRNAFAFAPVPGYLAQTLEDLSRSTLKHPPGYMAVYCNDGFTLIEALVAAVSGKTYPQFVADEILGPLGMVNSRYALAPFPAGSYAPAFVDDEELPQEFTQLYASGGLYSTPGDMLRFARMFMNGGRLGDVRVLSTNAVAAMGTDQTVRLIFNPTDGLCWGLGWDCVRVPGLAAVGVEAWQKNGGTAEYGTDFFVAPKERLAVLVTATSPDFKTGMLAERIMLNALVERGRIPAFPTPLKVPLPSVTPSDADLAAMTGYFARGKDLVRVEVQTDRTLKITQFNQSGTSELATALKLRSDGFFTSDAAPTTGYGTFLAEGERYLSQKNVGSIGHTQMTMPYAQRLLPRAPLSAAWRARIGQRWVMVDEDPNSLASAGGSPLLQLVAQDDLPGYVFVRSNSYQAVDPSRSDSAAYMFMKIPVNSGRDLSDLIVETRTFNGRDEEWLRWCGNLYRPVNAIPVPDYYVKLDGEGNAEWRRMPAAASLNITTYGAWRIYDGDFNSIASGTGNARGVNVPAGAYLRFFGEPYGVVWLS